MQGKGEGQSSACAAAWGAWGLAGGRRGFGWGSLRRRWRRGWGRGLLSRTYVTTKMGVYYFCVCWVLRELGSWGALHCSAWIFDGCRMKLRSQKFLEEDGAGCSRNTYLKLWPLLPCSYMYKILDLEFRGCFALWAPSHYCVENTSVLRYPMGSWTALIQLGGKIQAPASTFQHFHRLYCCATSVKGVVWKCRQLD